MVTGRDRSTSAHGVDEQVSSERIYSRYSQGSNGMGGTLQEVSGYRLLRAGRGRAGMTLSWGYTRYSGRCLTDVLLRHLT